MTAQREDKRELAAAAVRGVADAMRAMAMPSWEKQRGVGEAGAGAGAGGEVDQSAVEIALWNWLERVAWVLLGDASVLPAYWQTCYG